VTERGTVVAELEGARIVKIRMERGSRCEGCTSCSQAGGELFLLARNDAGSRTGDFVEVHVGEGKGSLGASVLVFLVPLLLFFAGFLVCRFAVRGAEGTCILTGLACATLWYVALPFVGRRFRAGFRPDARVLRRQSPGPGGPSA
jgi:positive regulator of sigma E activity